MCEAINYISKQQPECQISNLKNSAKILINHKVELDKTNLLTNLALACKFPDYCHVNWDSAFDCLTDSNVANLILDLSEVNHINTQDLDTFKALIKDAFVDFGKPKLWIVVKDK